jgi:hypothetical protein
MHVREQSRKRVELAMKPMPKLLPTKEEVKKILT